MDDAAIRDHRPRVAPEPESNDPPPKVASASEAKQDARMRSPFEAETLVAFAAAVGVGVFAVPFDVSKPIRYLTAVIAFVLVLAIFGRYPNLSRLLVKAAIKAGFPVLGALVIVLIIVIVRPSLRPPAGAVRVLVAGAAAFAFRLIEILTWAALARRRITPDWIRMTTDWILWSLAILLSLMEAGVGALGCALVRGADGGVEFTRSIVWTCLVGIASGRLWGSVIETFNRQPNPYVNRDEARPKNPLPPS